MGQVEKMSNSKYFIKILKEKGIKPCWERGKEKYKKADGKYLSLARKQKETLPLK